MLDVSQSTPCAILDPSCCAYTLTKTPALILFPILFSLLEVVTHGFGHGRCIAHPFPSPAAIDYSQLMRLCANKKSPALLVLLCTVLHFGPSYTHILLFYPYLPLQHSCLIFWHDLNIWDLFVSVRDPSKFPVRLHHRAGRAGIDICHPTPLLAALVRVHVIIVSVAVVRCRYRCSTLAHA